MEDFLDKVANVDAIKKEVDEIINELGRVESAISGIAKRSVTIHLQIKDDKNLETLMAHAKQFDSVMQEFNGIQKKNMDLQQQLINKNKELDAAMQQRIELEKQLQAQQGKTAAGQNQVLAGAKQIVFYRKEEKKSAEELERALYDAEEGYRGYTQSLVGAKRDLADYSTELARAKQQVKEYTKALAEQRERATFVGDAQKGLQELEERLGRTTARQEEYTLKVKEAKQEVKLAQIVEEGLAGSYEVREAMMKRLTATAKSMSVETEEQKQDYAAITQAINVLNDSLKESDAQMGNNQRNVGAYENATKGLRGVITNLTNDMAALELAGQKDSVQYVELQKRATEYRNSLRNVQATTNGLASNTASWDTLRNSLQALNVAFIQLKEMGGFAENSETLNSILKTLGTTIGFVSAGVSIYTSIGGKSVVMGKIRMLQSKALAKSLELEAVATGKATIAQRLFNAVAKANPYVLLATALITLVGAIALFSGSMSDAEKWQKMMNDMNNEATETIAKEVVQLNQLSKAAKESNLSINNQQKIIDSLNKVVEKTGQHFDTWEEAQRFLIENKDAYIQAMKEQALQQQYLNKYTEIYVEIQKLAREAANPGFWEIVWGSIRSGGDSIAGLSLAVSDSTDRIKELSKELEFLDSKIDPTVDSANKRAKQAEELARSLEEWNKKEVQKLTEKYQKEKQLLDDNGKDTTLLTKKYNDDIAKLNKDAADKQRQIIEKIADLRVSVMKEGREKEIATIDAAEKKELATIAGTISQKEEQRNLITEKYRQQREKTNEDWNVKDLQQEQKNWELKADLAEKGSQEWLDAQTEAINKARDIEIAEAKKTGANVADINKYYDKQIVDAFGEGVDARIKKAEEEVAERKRLIIEEEADMQNRLLDMYRNGEINKEQYEKQKLDISFRYAKLSIENEIAQTEKLLNSGTLSEEQARDIREKLSNTKKALSDAETEHELGNIDKQNEARKKAAETAKEYAQEAFNMAMDFIVQQQEARIADIDAQIEEVDAWKERELERLDESVMSEETRAAETKRINAQAEADRKKLEEEKRKEQQKQAIFEKAQAVAKAAINTALSITASAQMGFPAAIPFIAMAAILGAIQTALIIAQPLPKYRFGTDDHPGGKAWMGDGGKREYAVYPTGHILESASTPKVYDMPAHTKVFPDYASLMDYFRPEIPNYTSTATQAPDFSEGIERLEKVIKENRSVQNVQMNLDRNGIWWMSQNGTRKSRFVNGQLKIV